MTEEQQLRENIAFAYCHLDLCAHEVEVSILHKYDEDLIRDAKTDYEQSMAKFDETVLALEVFKDKSQ